MTMDSSLFTQADAERARERRLEQIENGRVMTGLMMFLSVAFPVFIAALVVIGVVWGFIKIIAGAA